MKPVLLRDEKETKLASCYFSVAILFAGVVHCLNLYLMSGWCVPEFNYFISAPVAGWCYWKAVVFIMGAFVVLGALLLWKSGGKMFSFMALVACIAVGVDTAVLKATALVGHRWEIDRLQRMDETGHELMRYEYNQEYYRNVVRMWNEVER
ncbi:hypothetical protein [Pontiella sp.]|uniref:hypothetical protein n=1 Tax=Pontiella sp. TaxID=2837462 RepID=UPI0035697FF5